MLLPGATGGPSGGLTAVWQFRLPRKAILSTAHARDRCAPRQSAAGEWLTWRRGSDGWIQSLAAGDEQNVASSARHGVGRCPTARTKARSLSRRRVVRSRYWRQGAGLDAVTGDLFVAVLPPSCRWGSSSVKRSIALYGNRCTGTSTCISWRSTPKQDAWSGTRKSRTYEGVNLTGASLSLKAK